MDFPPPYDLRFPFPTAQQLSLPQRNVFMGDNAAECFDAVPAAGDNVRDCPQPQSLLFAPSLAGDFLEVVPGSIPAPADTLVNGPDFNVGAEPKSEGWEQRNVYQNNSQETFVDYLHPGSVSTGSHLPLDLNRVGPFAEIEGDMQLQHVETVRFIDHEMEQLKQSILIQVGMDQLQAISLADKLERKDADIEILNKRINELEGQAEHSTAELASWDQKARESEAVIATLQDRLQQVCTQGRREGCGDSEVESTIAPSLRGPSQWLVCSNCWKRQARVVLDPCRHLCLCKDCEPNLHSCPLCQTPKSRGVEVYVP